MKLLTILEILLIAIAIGLFLHIYRRFLSKSISPKPQEAESEPKTNAAVENIKAANLIGKKKFKLIPYQEALEASRQFIYNIAKLVMQKFSPESKDTLLELGTKLYNAGVQYIHVVDVFKISLEKQKIKTTSAIKKSVKGRQDH